MTTTTIALRPSTVNDFDFFFELHKATLGPYVHQVWGWDDDDQRAYLSRTIDFAATQVIVVDGADAGRLTLADQDGDVYVGLDRGCSWLSAPRDRHPRSS